MATECWLQLKSPCGGKPADINWSQMVLNGTTGDIVNTILLACEDFPFAKKEMEKHISRDCRTKDYDCMKKLCKKYNNVIGSIVHMWCGTAKFTELQSKPSNKLLQHILQLTYNQAVTDPKKLNQYEPFSPEVYGETSFEFITDMINALDINSDDIFIDLGSGVGQVVLQMAAATPCKKCIGIEKADVPATYAKEMDKHFKFWMHWFGKKYGDYVLLKGDFFSEEFRTILLNSTLLFVNNFSFGPEVDHKLKLYFAEIKDAARIVSSKAFCPLNFRISDRNLTDIGAMMTVIKTTSFKPSWTETPVPYFIHTIDRTKLNSYFQRKNPKIKEENNICVNLKKNSFSDSLILNSSNNSQPKSLFGSTRKVWTDLCNNNIKASPVTDNDWGNEENKYLDRNCTPKEGHMKKKCKQRSKRHKQSAPEQKSNNTLKCNKFDLLPEQTIENTPNSVTLVKENNDIHVKCIKNERPDSFLLDTLSNDCKQERTGGPTTRKAWADMCNNKTRANPITNNEQDSNEENKPLQLDYTSKKANTNNRQKFEKQKHKQGTKKLKKSAPRVKTSKKLKPCDLDLIPEQTVKNGLNSVKCEPISCNVDKKLEFASIAGNGTEIDEFHICQKMQLLNFLARTTKSNFKNQVEMQIEKENARNAQLRKHFSDLEKDVNALEEESVTLFKKHFASGSNCSGVLDELKGIVFNQRHKAEISKFEALPKLEKRNLTGKTKSDFSPLFITQNEQVLKDADDNVTKTSSEVTLQEISQKTSSETDSDHTYANLNMVSSR